MGFDAELSRKHFLTGTLFAAFAPFAALVIVAHVAGKANAMTAFWCVAFFWLRLVHAAVYLAAVPYVRTVAFTLGFVAVAGLFWETVK